MIYKHQFNAQFNNIFTKMYRITHSITSFVLILTISTINSASINLQELNPDAGLNISQLTKKYGYPLETHQVQTQDGYLLTIHRIPHGRNAENSTEKRPPVLLMHGLLSNSVDWLTLGPEKSLAYILADGGYDVWLGNQRGNTWSRKHINLDPDTNSSQFFNFSFHEIGVFDLPAKIDHILETTQETSISYIGHSQGTTAFFIMAAEKPEYNAKIKLMQALAPVAYMENLENPFIRFAAENLIIVDILIESLKINEFFRYSGLFYEIGIILCSDTSEYQFICPLILNLFGGFDSEIDSNVIPVILTNTPAGASIKQILHYLQEIISKKFRQFDYGIIGNIAKYGSVDPPNYDTSRISAAISLHYSENDWMASVVDVERLAGELKNVKLRKVSLEKFNHLDFLWAERAVSLVYNDVLTELNSVTKN